MLITKANAARQLNKSRQALGKWQSETPLPEFFVKDEKGKFLIDDTHPAWIARRDRALMGLPVTAPRNKKNSDAKKKKDKVYSRTLPPIGSGVPHKNGYQPVASKNENPPPQNPGGAPQPDPEITELSRRASLADLKKSIYEADLKEEKLKQAKIDTLEKQKGLAPLDLLKHFFSYSDRIMRELYRRPHEISPQLSAYFIAGETEKAVAYMVKQLEAIVKAAQVALIEDLENEGFKYKKESE